MAFCPICKRKTYTLIFVRPSQEEMCPDCAAKAVKKEIYPECECFSKGTEILAMDGFGKILRQKSRVFAISNAHIRGTMENYAKYTDKLLDLMLGVDELYPIMCIIIMPDVGHLCMEIVLAADIPSKDEIIEGES